MSEGKKYGLFIPKSKEKNKQPILQKSVFGDDDEEEDDPAALAKAVKKLGTDSKLKRKTQLDIDKALEEDPNIYEYDAIYDKMQEERKAMMPGLGADKDKDRKPKYIENLLKTASQRKREYERRIERQVQKEREEEKGQYDDSESFVTSAYRKKMAEIAEEEERERREAAMEETLDVTKQKDLSGFYRHLLKQTTGEVKHQKQQSEEDIQNAAKTTRDSDSDTVNRSSRSRSRDRITSRQYRSRLSDSDEDSPNTHRHSKNHQTTSKASSRHRDTHRSRSRSPQYRSRSKEQSVSSRSKHRSSRHSERYRSRSPDRSHRSRSRDRHHRSKEKRSRSRDRHQKSGSTERDRVNWHKDRREQKDTKINRSREDKRKSEVQPPKQSPDKQEKDKKADERAMELMVKFSKRNVGDSVDDARARYLARKQGRQIAIAPPKEEDF